MAVGRDPERLQREIEELFADLWQVPRISRRGFRPQVDCYRTDDPPMLTVVVELPGVEPDDVQIHATPRALIVAGQRRRPRTPGRVYQQMELEYGPFERQIALAEEVDTARAKATYERGLLTIVLPLAQRARDTQHVSIEVKGTS